MTSHLEPTTQAIVNHLAARLWHSEQHGPRDETDVLVSQWHQLSQDNPVSAALAILSLHTNHGRPGPDWEQRG